MPEFQSFINYFFNYFLKEEAVWKEAVKYHEYIKNETQYFITTRARVIITVCVKKLNLCMQASIGYVIKALIEVLLYKEGISDKIKIFDS